MLLRDVMTRNIEEISPQIPIIEAAQKMRSLDVGALPVFKDGRPIGMLTDRDITLRAVAAGRDPGRMLVSEAMTPSIIFCYEDDDVREAAQIMQQKQIRRLVVVDQNNSPCGIVSLGDLATRMRDEHLSSEVLESVSEPAQPVPS
jgi:CBS domain-containing protein